MNPIEDCNLNWNFLERFGEEENIRDLRDLIITDESQEALQEIKNTQNQLGCCHHTQKWCGKKIDHTLGFAGNLVKATLTTGFVIAATGFAIDTAADHFTGHRPMQSMLQYNLRLLKGGYAMYQGESPFGSFSDYKDHFWESPFSIIKNATLTTAKATGSLLAGFVTNKAANKTGLKTLFIAIASTIFSYQLLKNSNEFSLVSSGFTSKEERVAKTIEEQKEVIQESQTEFFQRMADTLCSKGKGTLQDQYQAFYLSKKIQKNLPQIKEIVDQQSLPKSILRPLKKQVTETINKPFDLSAKDHLQLMAKDPRYAKDLAVPKRIRTLAEQAQNDDHLHLSYLAQSGGKLHAAISSMGAVCAGTYATLSATAVCAMKPSPSECNMFTSSAKTWIFAGMTATSLLGMGAYSVFKGRKHSKQAEKSYQEMLQHQRETRQSLLLHYTKLANAVKDLSKEEIQALQKQLPIMEQEIDSLNLKWISKDYILHGLQQEINSHL